MKNFDKKSTLLKGIAAIAVVTLASAQLAGCPGQDLPPVPVTVDLVLGLEIPAINAAAGSADVDVDEICPLFGVEEIEALVREVAGNVITDNLDITRIELVSTNIMATEGTFDPFTTAVFDLVVQNAGGRVLLLGMAADNDGLGTSFELKLDNPVDLLTDLAPENCGSPQIHLDGAGFLEAGDITFDVGLTLRVYTRIP